MIPVESFPIVGFDYLPNWFPISTEEMAHDASKQPDELLDSADSAGG